MIYDGFIFFNELDILEIRLNEMAEAVDVFVLVEATQTFQGQPKSLVYAENSERFAAFAPKIIHVVCEFPQNVASLYPNAASPAWAREFFQRDCIAKGLRAAKPDDVVIVSDVDEIIGAQKLRQAVAERRPGDVTMFPMAFYRYALNRRVKHEIWDIGPRMLERRHFTSAQDVRNLAHYASSFLKRIGLWRAHARRRNRRRCGIDCAIRSVEDSGWHFSSIGAWRDYVEKVSAFAHEEEKDKAPFLDEEAFLATVATTTECVSLGEMPAFVRDNVERFRSLLAPANPPARPM
jgi:beta-1,4-mannosyl-glycoprotein beta-1,4-N-acetylglucosaminyltransferase